MMSASATQAACMGLASSHGNATARKAGEVSSATKVKGQTGRCGLRDIEGVPKCTWEKNNFLLTLVASQKK